MHRKKFLKVPSLLWERNCCHKPRCQLGMHALFCVTTTTHDDRKRLTITQNSSQGNLPTQQKPTSSCEGKLCYKKCQSIFIFFNVDTMFILGNCFVVFHMACNLVDRPLANCQYQGQTRGSPWHYQNPSTLNGIKVLLFLDHSNRLRNLGLVPNERWHFS